MHRRPLARPAVSPRPLAPLLESDEATLTAARSGVLQRLDRAPDPTSRVEMQEHLRCEMRNALARAAREVSLAYAPTVPLSPFPLRLPRPSRATRGIASPAAFAETVADAWTPPRAPRRRPRWASNAPLLAIFVALAIACGLAAEHAPRLGRAGLTARVAHLVRAHGARSVRPALVAAAGRRR